MAHKRKGLQLLISLVEKRAILYDHEFGLCMKSEQLNKISEAAWDEIAKRSPFSKENCKRLWQKLRDAYERTLARRQAPLVVGKLGVKQIFKYEKEMEFLKPYVKLPNTSASPNKFANNHRTDFPIPSTSATNTNIIQIDDKNGNNKNDKFSEAEDNVATVISNDDVIMTESDATDKSKSVDELILVMGEHTVAIPVLKIDNNKMESNDDDVHVIIKPKDNSGNYKKRIQVEIDWENPPDDTVRDSVELNFLNVLGELSDVQDELPLELDSSLPTNDGDNVTKISKVGESTGTLANSTESTKSSKVIDDEDEESFYALLGKSANEISNHRERLKLRKEIISLVMTSVANYLTKSSENG